MMAEWSYDFGICYSHLLHVHYDRVAFAALASPAGERYIGVWASVVLGSAWCILSYTIMGLWVSPWVILPGEL